MEKRKEMRSPVDVKRIDPKEFELPETLFVSDIDTKVFQGIILQCLNEIDGISLVAGNFIDNFLGRGGPEIASGIQSEQDNRNHSVSIKIEVNIRYGLSIPKKAEEIQSKVVEEITRLTGLRVSAIHIFFRNIIPLDQTASMLSSLEQQITRQAHAEAETDTYNDNF